MVHGGIGAWHGGVVGSLHGGMALHGGALYGGGAFFFLTGQGIRNSPSCSLGNIVPLFFFCDRTRHKE